MPSRASVTARREVEIGRRLRLITRHPGGKARSGDRATEIAQGGGVQGPYGGWRREKISGFDLDKLWVGGYTGGVFFK